MSVDPEFEFLQAVPQVAPSAFIADTARLLGTVAVGEQASVWFGAVLRGDVQAIEVGPRSNLQDGCILHCSRGGWATRIGADCSVGHAAVLHSCVLEPGAFVGFGARVLDRCVIEGDAMLAAGALLTPGKVVRRGELWAGSPARLLRTLEPAEIEANRRTTARYVALAAAYRRRPPGAP